MRQSSLFYGKKGAIPIVVTSVLAGTLIIVIALATSYLILLLLELTG
jgi:hypothetical protein